MSQAFPSRLMELSQWLPGSRSVGDAAFQGVSIDSRRLEPGNLFIALKGARDGHHFLDAAFAAGAAGAIVSRPSTQHPAIEVQDTEVALVALAVAYRAIYPGLVMALTGSQGKTSTRGFLGAIMQAHAQDPNSVLITRGNFNNQLGVPLTLMRLNASIEVAVLELGASAVGDIQTLGNWSRPHIGCVLNARDAHLETFGSLANIVRGKGELIDCVSMNGTVVLPAEDPALSIWSTQVDSRDLWTFGRHAGDVRFTPKTDRLVEFETPLGRAEVTLPTIGLHFMENASAAIAMAMAADADLDSCIRGLSEAVIEPGRMTPLQGLTGHLVIDDTYNASPHAVRAAIDWLATQAGDRLLILGGLAELGDASETLMAELGRYASHAGIEHLITCGTGDAIGRDVTSVRHFESIEALCDALPELPAAAVTLVKGSRSAQMDRVIDALTGRQGGLH